MAEATQLGEEEEEYIDEEVMMLETFKTETGNLLSFSPFFPLPLCQWPRRSRILQSQSNECLCLCLCFGIFFLCRGKISIRMALTITNSIIKQSWLVANKLCAGIQY